MTEFDYELFAIRYATRDARRSEHFIGGDPHEGPMPMDYFVWVAKGGGRTFVIDTGFNTEVSEKRQRTFLRCPVQGLATLGIDANEVEDVILTHLHYDHCWRGSTVCWHWRRTRATSFRGMIRSS